MYFCVYDVCVYMWACMCFIVWVWVLGDSFECCFLIFYFFMDFGDLDSWGIEFRVLDFVVSVFICWVSFLVWVKIKFIGVYREIDDKYKIYRINWRW